VLTQLCASKEYTNLWLLLMLTVLSLALLLLLLQDGRSLQHSLTSTRAALKQADVRIAILEDRNLTLQQVRSRLQETQCSRQCSSCGA
jgi:hypothetical protein